MTTITDPTEWLRAYLDLLLQSHLTNRPPNPPYVYVSQAELLLKHGHWFTQAGNHPRLKRGAMQFCFFNAKRAAFAHRGEFRYFEGYAVSPTTGLPHPHAWVVDRAERAWDVTWQNEASALVGVEVPIRVLRAHWRTCGGASILQDHYHHFPCFQHQYDMWVPELVEHLERLRDDHCMAQVANGIMRLLPDGSMAATSPFENFD